jgi:hypothetical protein
MKSYTDSAEYTAKAESEHVMLIQLQRGGSKAAIVQTEVISTLVALWHHHTGFPAEGGSVGGGGGSGGGGGGGVGGVLLDAVRYRLGHIRNRQLFLAEITCNSQGTHVTSINISATW